MTRFLPKASPQRWILSFVILVLGYALAVQVWNFQTEVIYACIADDMSSLCDLRYSLGIVGCLTGVIGSIPVCLLFLRCMVDHKI